MTAVLPTSVATVLRASGEGPESRIRKSNCLTGRNSVELRCKNVEQWLNHSWLLIEWSAKVSPLSFHPPPLTHTHFLILKIQTRPPQQYYKNRSINLIIHTQQNACIIIQEMVLVHACMAPVPSPFPEFKMNEFLSLISGNKRCFMFHIDTSASSCQMLVSVRRTNAN